MTVTGDSQREAIEAAARANITAGAWVAFGPSDVVTLPDGTPEFVDGEPDYDPEDLAAAERVLGARQAAALDRAIPVDWRERIGDDGQLAVAAAANGAPGGQQGLLSAMGRSGVVVGAGTRLWRLRDPGEPDVAQITGRVDHHLPAVWDPRVPAAGPDGSVQRLDLTMDTPAVPTGDGRVILAPVSFRPVGGGGGGYTADGAGIVRTEQLPRPEQLEEAFDAERHPRAWHGRFGEVAHPPAVTHADVRGGAAAALGELPVYVGKMRGDKLREHELHQIGDRLRSLFEQYPEVAHPQPFEFGGKTRHPPPLTVTFASSVDPRVREEILNSATPAATAYKPGGAGQQLVLNDLEDLTAVMSAADGVAPSTRTWEGITTHEFGHAFARVHGLGDNGQMALALEKFGLTPPALRRVSLYATADAGEGFAELFGMAHTPGFGIPSGTAAAQFANMERWMRSGAARQWAAEWILAAASKLGGGEK